MSSTTHVRSRQHFFVLSLMRCIVFRRTKLNARSDTGAYAFNAHRYALQVDAPCESSDLDNVCSLCDCDDTRLTYHVRSCMNHAEIVLRALMPFDEANFKCAY